MSIDPTQIKFICAGETHLEAASSILTEAAHSAHWRIERGIPIWKPDDFLIEKLRPVVERNELYLAQYEGEYVGTLYFQWEDERFWPNVPAGESAFLHRIAVSRRMAGHGVLKEMIHWAGEKARSAGRQYLRLDCDGNTPKLCAHYESLGFKRHSQEPMDPYLLTRYEIDLK
jgi:GNAT superfamily N-acetyltransferase